MIIMKSFLRYLIVKKRYLKGVALAILQEKY